MINELLNARMEASVAGRSPTPRIAAIVEEVFIWSTAQLVRKRLLPAIQGGERATRHRGRRPPHCFYHQLLQYRTAIPPTECPHLLHPQTQHLPSPDRQIRWFPSLRAS